MAMEPISNNFNTNRFNISNNGNGVLKDNRIIDIEADRILEKLGAGEGLKPFVCKAFYNLPQARVIELAEVACEKATLSKAKYFTTIVSKDAGFGRWKDGG